MNVSAMNLRAKNPQLSHLTYALVVALAAGVALAAAPAAKRVEGNHVHILVPASWEAQPALAETMKKSLSGNPGLTGDAVAWGDAKKGVTGLLLWIDMTEPMGDGAVRDVQTAFLGGVIKSMPRAGESSRREETATHIVHYGSSKAADSDLDALFTSVIDKKGILHGYMLTCVRTGDAKARAKAVAACDALLKSFELSWKDAELKPLEKK
jgi:hypothetical protein